MSFFYASITLGVIAILQIVYSLVSVFRNTKRNPSLLGFQGVSFLVLGIIFFIYFAKSGDSKKDCLPGAFFCMPSEIVSIYMLLAFCFLVIGASGCIMLLGAGFGFLKNKQSNQKSST